MISTQPALILALDDRSRLLTNEIARSLTAYRLSDGELYPTTLWKEAWLDGSERASREEKDNGCSTIALSLSRDQFRDALHALTVLTLGASEWQRLRTIRQIDPKPRVVFLLVGLLGDLGMQVSLLKVLEAIHSIPSFGRGRSDVLGVFLLPELSLAKEATTVAQQRAQAFASLQVVESIMQHTKGQPWEDWFPLDRIWLIDSQDRNGRGLGSYETLAPSLGECFASLIAESLLESELRSLGADERETRDLFNNSRCHTSIGFAQLNFPKVTLKEQLFEHLRVRTYREYVLRNSPLLPDTLVLRAREFLANTLALGELAADLEQTDTGGSILPDFSLKDFRETHTDEFCQSLESTVHSFKEAELAEAKLRLIGGANRKMEELVHQTDAFLEEAIDYPDKGPTSALAIAEELVGKNTSETTEERRPIQYFMIMYRKLLETELGFVTPSEEKTKKLSRVLERAAKKLKEINTRITAVRREENKSARKSAAQQKAKEKESPSKREDSKTPSETKGKSPSSQEGNAPLSTDTSNAPSGQETALGENDTLEGKTWWSLRKLEKRQRTLEARVGKLQAMKERLASFADRLERLWADAVERGRLFKEVDARREASIRYTLERLRDLDRESARCEREIQNIKDRIGRELLRILVIFPCFIASMFVIGVALAIRVGGIPPAKLFGMLAKNAELIFLFAAGYFVFAAEEYFRRVWRPLIRLRRERDDLRRRSMAHRELALKGWRDLFRRHFQCRVFDRSVSLLNSLTNTIDNRRQRIQAFLEATEKAASSKGKYLYPQQVGLSSVISGEDVKYFEKLCFEQDIQEEVRPLFSSEAGNTTLSNLVLRNHDPLDVIDQRLKAFYDKRFESRIGGLSIEQLLVDHWKHIHPVVSPQLRVAEVFALSPFVHLVEPPGEPEVGQEYTVGIYQGEESRLFDSIGTPPYSLIIFPSSSKERIALLCASEPFSVAYLSRLPDYKKAFVGLSKKEDVGSFYAESVDTIKLPPLIPD